MTTIKQLITLMLSVFMLQACTRHDNDIDMPITKDGEAEISILLSVGGNGDKTYAVTDNLEFESKIDDVWLIIFSKTDDVIYVDSLSKSSQKSAYTAKIDTTTLNKIDSDCKAYVAANISNNLAQSMSIRNIKTIEDLKGLEFKAPMSPTAELTATSLPCISAECAVTVDNNIIGIVDGINNSAAGTIKVIRTLCRLKVVRGMTSELTKVVIRNIATKGSLFGPIENAETMTISDSDVKVGGSLAGSGYYYVYPTSSAINMYFEADGLSGDLQIDNPSKGESYTIGTGGIVSFVSSSDDVTVNSGIIETINENEQTIKFAAITDGTTVSLKDASTSWLTFNVSSLTKAATLPFKLNKDDALEVIIDKNSTDSPRSAVLVFELDGKSVEITITQNAGGDKYMILVVAGQSNAVGYDESPVYPFGVHKPNPMAFQLSYRYGTTNPCITQLTWCSENLQDMTTRINTSGLNGTKGIHLPLANEILQRIPSDYKVLIIPVAYGSSSLLSNNNTSTAYNATTMQPSVMNAALQWGIGRPYNRAMIDRVKYTLAMNPQNKFLGVVWCQGENDARYSEAHYSAFNLMTQDFFNQINAAGYGVRCPKGIADKDLWYNYSSTKYWSDWYLSASNAAPVFGGYKAWNPNTFIHVPFNSDTNEVNGNGATSSNRASHFGNDAYSKVIAPMVAECMDNNGGLFNGKAAASDRFVEKDIKTDAATLGGQLTDSDLKTGLQAFYALNGSYSESVSANYSITPSSGASFVAGAGLIDIYGSVRNQSVFSVSATSTLSVSGDANTGDWTIAFMFKRTGNVASASQSIISGSATTPFIGFKKYAYNGGAGTYAEFVVEPIQGSDPLKAVAGQFMDADNVRTQNGWIHYVITYAVSTKLLSIYMNGQLVGQKSITSTPALNMSSFSIGASTGGATGEMCNFGIWNNVLAELSVKKLYLHSNYGFTK